MKCNHRRLCQTIFLYVRILAVLQWMGTHWNRRSKQAENKNDNECSSYCGMQGRGKQSPNRIRRKQFAAYRHKCGLCKYEHCLEFLCRFNEQPGCHSWGRIDNRIDQESVVFDAFCTISDDKLCYNNNYDNMTNAFPLGHHIYDSLSETWVKPQPFINVTIQTDLQDYTDLGLQDMYVPSVQTSAPAMTDTDCQSCLAGLNVVYRLRLRKSDLVPVTMLRHTANNKGINILVGLVYCIACNDSSGSTVVTKQITFISESYDKSFLS